LFTIVHLLDLHRQRIQTVLFGGTGMAPEEAYENQLLEEELNLQLHLLSKQMPPSTLFPEMEETIHPSKKHSNPKINKNKKQKKKTKKGVMSSSQSVPYLAAIDDEKAAENVLNQERISWWEEMLEEGVIDSLGICALIALAWVVPQLVLD
jgi:hypothetical protein